MFIKSGTSVWGSVFLLAFVLGISSCTEESKNQTRSHQLKVVEAKGYVVPPDSIVKSNVVLLDENKLKNIPLGKCNRIPTNTNVRLAGTPDIINAGIPAVSIPGQGALKLPKTVPAAGKTVVTGIPEEVIAKDAVSKDQNPENFSSFGKLQGLKHGTIRCMLEDKTGNLWFGTDGGVSRYNGKFFTHFTEKEGLCNNRVLSMLEDKNGNLWFGTGGGICRYDGAAFTSFIDNEGQNNNVIYSIVQDKGGNLWFASNVGVSRYNGKEFTRFTDKQGLNNNVVVSMLEDKSGNLWFGTHGSGVCRYDGKSFSSFTEREGLLNNVVSSIIQDKSGNLWFGTDGGASRYDGKSFTQFTETEGLINNRVYSILEDKSGSIWFGTSGGVSRYDESQSSGGESNRSAGSFTQFTEKEGLSINHVLCILKDKSGNLWFGTYLGGVNRYDGKSFTHFTEKEGLSNNVILSLIKDKNGNLWFGTFGGGVCRYDEKSFTHLTEKEGLGNNRVYCILEDKNGILWFGTDAGVSRYDGKTFTHFTEKEGLCYHRIYSILEDRTGNLWFGSYGGGVSRYDGNRIEAIEQGEKIPSADQQDLKKEDGKFVKSFTQFTVKNGLSNNNVNTILQDKSGNIWFGTDGGVSRYDSKSFTRFTEKEGLSNIRVYSILEDKSGILWFGTDGGVNRYDGKRFIHFTEKEGLSNNVVLSIIEDKSKNLWFGTRFGLSELNANQLNSISESVKSGAQKEDKVFFKNRSYEDGFLGIGCNRNAILEARNGTIWIGANDRLAACHPEESEGYKDTITPCIQVTGVALYNENIQWVNLQTKKDSTVLLGNGVSVGHFEFDGISKWYSLPENLSLAYNNNYLTFSFIGITMNQPKKVKYQYKLEGLDENWSALTLRTEAPYGNLPQGHYTFKVKAMNAMGYWSKEFDYTFTIRPPWWKTWWFRAFAGISIVLALYLLYRLRTASLRKDKEMLEQTVVERTAEVVRQKHLVEEQKNEIIDSITYAKRLQQAILPSAASIKHLFPQSFLLYKPKDIVAGDFYWMHTSHDAILIAACDCTGHGVPGAMVSIVCSNALNRTVNEFGQTVPGKILDKVTELVLETFSKSGEEVKDGMDISLLSMDKASGIIQWSGANNPLWIVNDSEFTEIKADKQPIGKSEKRKPFQTHSLTLAKSATLYLITDGYADQFGPDNKKLMKKKFRELILSIQHKTMDEQQQLLDEHHEKWKGYGEQTDDITVIGIRLQTSDPAISGN